MDSSDGTWDEREWKCAFAVYVGLWPNEKMPSEEALTSDDETGPWNDPFY